MTKFFIKTHGCQMNEYDSGKISDLLIDSCGYEKTDSAVEADILIINTCSIRKNAANKVFSGLGRWRPFKEENPNLIIAVAGCIPSLEGENIFKQVPYVDVVFGPQTLHRLPEMLKKVQQGEGKQIDISFPEIEKFDDLPKPHAEGPNAYVTIMEGCNNFCAYCVVPYTRGREWSRDPEGIIEEIKRFAKLGVKEINLLGQNVNAYKAESKDGTKFGIAELIREVAKIDEIKRIRFTTSHPKWFGDEMIEAFKDVPKLVNHLHLPVQSGSNHILELMRRGYTAEEYKEKVNKLREVRSDISISSDFIVGFPGESEENHNETLALIKDIGFDQSFSFVFSSRPGTKAASLKDDTPIKEKKKRLIELQDIINKNAAKISDEMVGTIQSVLVSGVSKKGKGMISGRTENNRVVNFSGDESLIGEMVNVEITEALPNSLRGRQV